MAIHELCRTKSAMMCLIVRTSIHPTSASTGTEDDMWENDKADALAGTVWSRTDRRRRWAQPLLKLGPIWPVLPFYDISRTRMHLGELKKMRAVAAPRYGPK